MNEKRKTSKSGRTRVHEQKTEFGVDPEESRLSELGQGSWLVRITLMEFLDEVRSVFA